MLRDLKKDLARRVPDALVRETAKKAYEEWRRIARNTLKTSKRAYLRSIRFDGYKKNGRYIAVLSLTGGSVQDNTLAQMVELGLGPGGIGTSGPYDMRKCLLRGPGVKTGARGKYRDIPFSRRGRKSSMKGAPEIERVASRRVLLQARKMKIGERMPAGEAKKLRKHHAADALAGLKKDRRRPRSTGYVLFRRISYGGNRNSWISPGLPPRNLRNKVLLKFGKMVEVR